MISKALLLIGSPRGERSNSLQIGIYLAHMLRERGVMTEKQFINRLVDTTEGRQQLLAAVDKAELIVLTFPLYVDGLPAPTTRALEQIHEHRKANPKRQPFMAIVNCGFPEPHQNRVAMDICRKFAAESGLEWMGCAGISFGMLIAGRPLESVGPVLEPLRKGLDNAAASLAEGRPLSPEVGAQLYMGLLPPSVAYAQIVPGENIWHPQATPQALERMYDRPYER